MNRQERRSMFKGTMVVSDFTLALHNRQATPEQIHEICKGLKYAKGFGVMIPSEFLSSISVPYKVISDTDKILSILAQDNDDNSKICAVIYKATNSVQIVSI